MGGWALAGHDSSALQQWPCFWFWDVVWDSLAQMALHFLSKVFRVCMLMAGGVSEASGVTVGFLARSFNGSAKSKRIWSRTFSSSTHVMWAMTSSQLFRMTADLSTDILGRTITNGRRRMHQRPAVWNFVLSDIYTALTATWR